MRVCGGIVFTEVNQAEKPKESCALKKYTYILVLGSPALRAFAFKMTTVHIEVAPALEIHTYVLNKRLFGPANL